MTFYLKYRSQKIDDLDLENIREQVKIYSHSKNIPHAFLFAGPKGTGKTSAARILAKIVNCTNKKSKMAEPCNKCDQCKLISSGNNIDVIELDAASHRGIDDIRNLRDAVKLAPAKASKKVYIIDESHMLTTEASNALLKTLEEPPEHVIFILATTNPEKLLPTILSRSTLLKFEKASTRELLRSLKRVVKNEKLKTNDEALKLIAQSSDGSFRDAHKILEQLSLSGKSISMKKVKEQLGNEAENVKEFIDFLVNRKTRKAIKYIERLNKDGRDINLFIRGVMNDLRAALLTKVGIGERDIEGLEKNEIIDLLELLAETELKTQVFSIEQLPLELAVIKWAGDLPGDSDQNGKQSIQLASKAYLLFFSCHLYLLTLFHAIRVWLDFGIVRK